MKNIFPPLIIACLVFCNVSVGQVSQEQRNRRRALVEDLLKGLIESQAEPQRTAPRPGQNVRPDTFPKNNSGRLDPNMNRRPGNGVVIETSADMLSARRELKNWSKVSNDLVKELRYHEHESPALRPYLADAMKTQASINALVLKAELYPTLPQLINDFGAIDRDWRVLSHRLKQSGALSSECMGLVNSIGNLDTQLCGLFKIEPQLNRQELMRLTTELNANYKHLVQDVYYQTRGKPGGQAILRQGQELYTIINESSALIPRGGYDSIVNAYKNCNVRWREFSGSLRKISDQRIRRDIQEIETLGAQIHEQLWLPVELDRDYINHLTSTIAQDANRVFDSVSINQLLKCEQPGLVLNSVREFNQTCDAFARTVSNGRSQSDLSWDFKLFQDQWDKIHDTFHNLKDPQIDQQLEEIDYAMGTLKNTFGDGPVIDHQMMTQIAANLDQLCHQLNDDIHRRVDRRRYDNGFHRKICAQAESLHDLVHDMHRDVVSKRGRINDGHQLPAIFDHWVALRPMINECKPEDLNSFREIRRQIEPLMVKLQVVFSD